MSESLAFIKKQCAYAAIKRNMNKHGLRYSKDTYHMNRKGEVVKVVKFKPRQAAA